MVRARPRVSFLATLTLLSLLCPPLLAQTWEIEVLDNGRQLSDVTDRSMRVDALGHPHIAYGCNGLHYAWHDGAAWHDEEVAFWHGHDAVGASLALDATGFPHVTYRDPADSVLTYAYKNDAGWQYEAVDSVRSGALLALDSSDRPHISFTDPTSGELRYARRDPTGWHFQTVDGDGYASGFALDSSGYPHISYRHGVYPEEPYTLNYAYLDGMGWHVQTIEPVGGHGGGSSLVMDATGLPHVSYYEHLGRVVKYACLVGTSWYIQIVDTVPNGYAETSLALDVSGCPRIAYTKNLDLKFAHLIGSSWHTETVDPVEEVTSASLALDSLGNPHIGYYSGHSGVLRYTSADSSGRWWQSHIVNSRRHVGDRTSLALDGSGNPHVSYRAGTYVGAGTLLYMRQGGSIACGQAVADMGAFDDTECTSLALDASDSPHIAFSDYSSLKYAYADTDGWQVQTVTWYGRDPSLALGSDGHAHVSYGGMSPESCLGFASEDETGWHLEAVDSRMVLYTSLDLDQAGYPHISYYDAVNEDLRYAYEDSAGWHVETVATQGDVGRYSSLALDALGFPHICYAQYDVPRLKYVYRDATGWHGEDADSRPCEHISLALDAEGRPHVSYYDASDRILRYVFRDTVGWHTQIVDSQNSQGSVGRYTSLALGSDGRPHITYWDVGSYSLKYAHMAGLPAQDDPFLPMRITAVDVWPNPARGILHARLVAPEGQGTVRLTVVDLLGRRVMSLQQEEAIGPEDSITLRLPDSVPTGQYFVKVEGDGSRQFVPITVVK